MVAANIYPMVAVGGVAAYGTLFVCAFGSLLVGVTRSLTSGRCSMRYVFLWGPGAMLSLTAGCRVAWMAMAFHPDNLEAFLKSAALDSIASLAWNAWIAINLSVALPSTGAQKSPLGIWRDGLRWARCNRGLFILFCIVNILITIPETLCIIWYSDCLKEGTDDCLLDVTDFMCRRAGRADVHTQGAMSILPAIVIWLLRRRVLAIVKELDAPVSPGLRALLQGMAFAVFLLCIRAGTLFVSAGFFIQMFCPGHDTECRNSKSPEHVVTLVLGYWLPECLLPLTGAVLGWKAYSARKGRAMTHSNRLDRIAGTRRRIVGHATSLLTTTSRRYASMRRSPFSRRGDESNGSRSLLSSRWRSMSSEDASIGGQCSNLEKGVSVEMALSSREDDSIRGQCSTLDKGVSVEMALSSREDDKPKQRRVVISTEEEPPRAHTVRFSQEPDESTAPATSRHRRTRSVASIVDSVRASTSEQSSAKESGGGATRIRVSSLVEVIGSMSSSLKLRGSLLERQSSNYSAQPISRHAYQYAARNGTLIDVLEVMEESHFVWQVAAAYLPLVQLHMMKQMELIRRELRSEGLRVGRSHDEIESFQPAEFDLSSPENSCCSAGTSAEESVSAFSKRAKLIREAQGHGEQPETVAPNLSRQLGSVERPTQLLSRSILEELLFEVSAGLGCSRLHWLTVLYEKQRVALHSIDEPLTVSRNPCDKLAAAGLPSDLTFKPSRLKNSEPLAYLACNCHTQHLFVDAHVSGPVTHSASAAAVATSQDTDASPFIGGRYDLVSCGCPSAHMIKSPGLMQLEAKIAKADDRLEAESKRQRPLRNRTSRHDPEGAADQHDSPASVVEVSSEESEKLRRKREWLLLQRTRRLPVCVSQALGAITTILHASIMRALAHAPSDLKQWAACGFLVGWESLLSTHGSENRMIGDFFGAVVNLQTLKVRLAASDGCVPTVQLAYQSPEQARESSASSFAFEVTKDLSENILRQEFKYGLDPDPLLLTLALPMDDFSRLPPEIVDGPPLAVRICMFSQGVNETQTVANATGKTALQETINLESLKWIESYARTFVAHTMPASTEAADAQTSNKAKGAALLESGTLEVTNISCIELGAADSNGLSDPYVTLQLGRRKAWRSKVVAKTLAPSWKEVYRVKGVLGELIQSGLHVRVMDRDWVGRDDELGDMTVELHELERLAETGAISVQSRNLSTTGTISFDVRWTCADVPLALGAAILDASIPSGASVSADGTPQLPKELIEVASEEELRAWEIRLLLGELRAVIEAAADRKLFDRKETRILTLSSALVRLLGGRRLVSCKSGKDRTGMSVTADQVNLLTRWHQMPPSEAWRILDEMRKDGCRMDNTYKNIGKRGYAFNGFQRLFLPNSLRAASDTTLAGAQS